MNIKGKAICSLLAALFLLCLLPAPALAGFDSAGPITMYYPDDLTACTPIMFGIYAIGTAPGWRLQYDVFQVAGGEMELLSSNRTHGNYFQFLVPQVPAGARREIAIRVSVFDPAQDEPYQLSGHWTIACQP